MKTAMISCQCDQRLHGGSMMCCAGRNSNCYVRMPNPSKSSSTRRLCYCDEYCKMTGDCCADFDKIKDSCRGARDCKVSEWTSWTACSNDCGVGIMKRKRFIVETPQNGGKACPALRQKRGCALNRCKRSAQTAFILPADPYRRVPKGLFGFEQILPAPKQYNPEENKVDSYCINFKLMMKRYQCQNTWADKLDTSLPVCVECQPRVLGSDGHCRGEGVSGVRSHWKAFLVPRCHGDWIRLGPAIPNCTCTQKYFSNFVFV
eukprot:gene13753-15192_t